MAKTTMTALALSHALAVALMALPLAAQTTEAPATEAPAGEAPATDAPAEGAVTSDGLSMGTEVAGSAVGDTYVAASFEAWEQRCVRTASGIDPCQLYILLKDEKGNNVAEFTMFGLPPGGEGPAVAGATFIAPLETLLTTGMAMKIDEGAPKGYPFTFCTQIGCVARLGFTAEEVAEMKKGATATIIIVPYVAPKEQVKLTLSLKGFTAGLAAVDAANAAADAAVASTDGAAPAEAVAPAANE
ncbi:MAG: invasion associated locus B family protein [Rhodobacterales bacterium]|nr:invasion associated locus B family protein [Rhodobacterales bacterium]